MAATFENEIGSEEVSAKRVRRQYGFFDSRKSDYSMEKVNHPEKTVKKKQKTKETIIVIFFILGQIERLQTRRLNETVGFMIVTESPDEIFINYAYDKDKSKVLYSHYRRRIPNSFSRTIFNRHRAMIETGEIDSEFSNINFFLHSITDRSEDINHYLKNGSISPTDITQKQFDDWASCEFNSAELDLFGPDKSIMSGAVIQCLRHINDTSNSNLVRNADAFLSQKKVKGPVDWI